MTKNKKIAYQLIIFAVMLSILAVVCLLNVMIGSSNISAKEIFDIIAGNIAEESTNYMVIMKIRLPRALVSILCGGALAVAGLLLQTFFNNPIVEPYVLGISSGSSLFVALVMLGGFTFGVTAITPIFLFIGAFIGAMVIMSIVIIASQRVKSIVTLLIIGMMAGYICSAVSGILVAFAEKEQIANYSMWTMGSFAGFTWARVGILVKIVVPTLFVSLMLPKSLNAMNMGDRYAQSMGVNVKFLRGILILLSSILTAAVTALAGPISFIGLAVPHICRIVLKTSDNKVLLPATIVCGGVMASVCDFVARNIMSPIELPLGAITSIIGAPIVVYLLTKKNN